MEAAWAEMGCPVGVAPISHMDIARRRVGTSDDSLVAELVDMLRRWELEVRPDGLPVLAFPGGIKAYMWKHGVVSICQYHYCPYDMS